MAWCVHAVVDDCCSFCDVVVIDAVAVGVVSFCFIKLLLLLVVMVLFVLLLLLVVVVWCSCCCC